MPRRFWSLRSSLRVAGALVVVFVGLTAISTDRFRAFGGAPAESAVTRLQASPHFVDGRFENVEPTALMTPGSSFASLVEWATGAQMRVPTCPLPIVTDGPRALAAPAASELRVTWLGHSTTLVEVDGTTVLTDPMWSDRASPSTWLGPHRFHPPPIAIADLPHVDAVLVSHEHYDHLDMASVRAIAARGVPFHVPLGIGAHLAAWGVPAAQIVEHDWWEEASLPGGVRIVSTPARHFDGRGVPWRTGAFWTSWSIVGPVHRVFFSGDTGRTDAMREISAREGPFDLALIEIGQFHPSWGDIHLGPVGALDAFAALGAKALLPIHWATFALAYHDWSEPAETLVREAGARGAVVFTPRLGEPIEPTRAPITSPWWRALPPIAARCP